MKIYSTSFSRDGTYLRLFSRGTITLITPPDYVGGMQLLYEHEAEVGESQYFRR